MTRYTKLTGFWLFVNAHKHFYNDRGPYKPYFVRAERDYNLMLDHFVSLWDECAREIQQSTLAKLFTTSDSLLKMLGEECWEVRRCLLQFRMRMCYELYLKMRPLLLQSLEICP